MTPMNGLLFAEVQYLYYCPYYSSCPTNTIAISQADLGISNEIKPECLLVFSFDDAVVDCHRTDSGSWAQTNLLKLL